MTLRDPTKEEKKFVTALADHLDELASTWIKYDRGPSVNIDGNTYWRACDVGDLIRRICGRLEEKRHDPTDQRFNFWKREHDFET